MKSSVESCSERVQESDIDMRDYLKRSIKVAGIMGRPRSEGDYKEQNYRETDGLIREAAQAGARLICTFEQFLDGYGFDANKIQNMADKRIGRYEVMGKSKYVKRLGDPGSFSSP